MYIIYSVISIIQFVLLLIWSFTQKGVIEKRRNLEDIGYYYYETCSIGNEHLLTAIFGISAGLLIFSIVKAFRGKDSKLFL